MIPDDQVRFLAGPNLLFAGTRNRQLRPAMSWAAGCTVDPVKNTIIFLLPEVESAQVLSDLKDNGMVALTAVEPLSHKSYQYKGCYINSRRGGEEFRGIHDIHKAKAASRLNEANFPGHLYARLTFWPVTIVTFRVEEIFLQTPGPGAGQKVEFVPEPV